MAGESEEPDPDQHVDPDSGEGEIFAHIGGDPQKPHMPWPHEFDGALSQAAAESGISPDSIGQDPRKPYPPRSSRLGLGLMMAIASLRGPPVRVILVEGDQEDQEDQGEQADQTE